VAAISANSVLPALREAITLRTEDGLTLVGELALPAQGDPTATIICVHPLPTHGGMMDSHLLRKMAWRLPALANIAVLRFNTRGTASDRGVSDGSFDSARGEGLDLAAAVQFVHNRGLPSPWLVGWSFGTDVIMKAARHLPGIVGVFLISPPLRFTSAEELEAWRDATVPVHALIPEFDDFLPPDRARPAFAGIADVAVISDAKHLWVGEPFVRIVLNALTTAIEPGRMPLPEIWDGPMERWSDL
jgi:alpha/beta superfamily hydrolase